MVKKKANAPKKIVGGRVLGKEGDIWYLNPTSDTLTLLLPHIGIPISLHNP